MLGGSARFEREQAAARDAFERELAKHRAAEADRQKRLAEFRASYDQQAADAAKAVMAHNAAIDQFEQDFCAGEPEMEDKHATKGIMVTTSWVTKDGHAFATRHGRMQVMECEELKFLCKEHLGLDILIGLPKPPPRR
jgi:hypothetical protein